jgi:hypothetical protein
MVRYSFNLITCFKVEYFINNIKTTQVSRFPDIGYEKSERMCLPTNLSKVLDSIWLIISY